MTVGLKLRRLISRTIDFLLGSLQRLKMCLNGRDLLCKKDLLIYVMALLCLKLLSQPPVQHLVQRRHVLLLNSDHSIDNVQKFLLSANCV